MTHSASRRHGRGSWCYRRAGKIDKYNASTNDTGHGCKTSATPGSPAAGQSDDLPDLGALEDPQRFRG